MLSDKAPKENVRYLLRFFRLGPLSVILNLRMLVLQLPGDSFSPALEAMIQVQGRITAEMGGDKDGIVTTRLLVPTNQIGCLLGKGGSIIEDMRRATRANIRVLPKDTLPRCAMEADELVQVHSFIHNKTVTCCCYY